MTPPAAKALSSGSNPLIGDLWGGFASMLVALPSSIAYGVAIYGVLGGDFISTGVMAGILGAIAIGLVAPALGGAPRLISAPCAPAAAVLTALAADLAAGRHGHTGPVPPAQVVALLMVVALLSGGLQLLYGAIGGGRLIKYIPYPVVSGYLSGVGVLIFLSQAPKFLGLPKGASLWAALADPRAWNWPSVTVGAITIGGTLLAPRLTKAVPAAILGLTAGLAAYFALGAFTPALLRLDGNPLVIGRIGAGPGAVLGLVGDRWAALRALDWSVLRDLFMPALTLSVLLSIDTLKTCVVVDAITRSRHQSNRELIGQGAANLASALCGGMPGAGTMGATLVNVNSGGVTRRSGVLEGVFVLLAFLLLGGLIAWVPIAALAGILIVVAGRMIDWRSFALLRQRTTLLDFSVIGAVVVVAVGANLIAAAGVGLALAILLFIREQIRGSVIRRKFRGQQISSKKRRLPAEEAVLERQSARATVCELQGSLFFGTTDQLLTELQPDLRTCRYLVFDLRRVQSVDFTAAHLFEQIEAILSERGGSLVFCRMPASLPSGQDLKTYFAHVGVAGARRRVQIFETRDDALEWVEDQILREEGLLRSEDEVPLPLAEFDLLRELGADGGLAALAGAVSERSCPGGEAIFRLGDRGDELFLIRRGLVRIVLPLDRGSHHNLASIGRGDFFGEMAFIDHQARSADALAVTATDLFVLSRARFDALERAHPLLGVRLFERLARVLALRLRRTDTELRALHDA